MKGKILVLSTMLFLVLGIFLGFSSLNDNPKKDKSPQSDRAESKVTSELKKLEIPKSDFRGGGNNTEAAYYTDDFNGGNTVADLQGRGYLVYLNGGPAGTTAAWFQGNPLVFNAFEGPTSGYVAANFNATTGVNPIDNWLILPALNVAVGDAIKFYARSNTSTSFPDSFKVMYSATGGAGILPSDPSWVQLAYFRALDANWELKSFAAPAAGSTARFAIRYFVINGGPSGANSDFVGVDLLTVESPAGANDIATTSINAPGNTTLPTPTIAPKATFTNVGSANKTNIPVTYKITGPVNYTNNKVISSLNTGASTQVTFDSTFLPTAGTYNITVYCALAVDDNRLNDTLKTTITVSNPNYGGGGTGTGGYFFANSTSGANGAPSKPKYCRLDTTGSTSLVVNNVLSVPLSAGTIDDGRWNLVGVGGLRKVKFFGVAYDSIFIGTNGLICFTSFVPGSSNWNPPANGLPAEGPGGGCRPGIYPSWNDMDWGDAFVTSVNRLSYKIDNTKNLLLITYDRAPVYFGDAEQFQTYQVVMELQKDTVGAPNSNIQVGIDSSFNAINLPYLVGIQDGTGANYLQYTFINGAGNVISPGPLFDGTDGVAIEFGPNASNLTGFCKVLRLGAKIEGYWSSPVYTPDTISVEIRSAITPFNIIETATGKQDANGNIELDFGKIQNGVPYYIVVKHRNALETWSKSGGEIWTASILDYNFGSSASQAYGNNLTFLGGSWTIYSGDVNQDGTVDITDVGLIENDAYNFVSGYVVTDLNCDGVVDLVDQAIADNNAYNFVTLQRP